MANKKQNHTQNKVFLGVKVDPEVRALLEKIAAKEDRSLSNVTSRLLQSHPTVVSMTKNKLTNKAEAM
jgi:hypothetical protein